DLDAEEVDRGPRLAAVQQKQALAEADLDLDGPVVTEDLCPRQRRWRRRHHEQVRLQLLQRESHRTVHAQPSSLRTSGTPRMSAWNTIVAPTKPWTLKIACLRFSLEPLPISTSRSPGR